MLKFSKFRTEVSSVDMFTTMNISKNAFDRLVEGLVNMNECAFIIPNQLKLDDYSMIRSYFMKEHTSLYSVACKKQNLLPMKMYIVPKKPTMTTESFKELLNGAYYELKNISVLYSGTQSVKSLHEMTIHEEYCSQKTTNFYESYISQILLKDKFEILGLEVPVTESAKKHFTESGLLIFPLNDTEISECQSWEKLLCDNHEK